MAPGRRSTIALLVPLPEAVHERLAQVTIERLHWSEFIARYDRAQTLFYIDPPCFGCEGCYGADDAGAPLFDRAQFGRMADSIDGVAPMSRQRAKKGKLVGAILGAVIPRLDIDHPSTTKRKPLSREPG